MILFGKTTIISRIVWEIQEIRTHIFPLFLSFDQKREAAWHTTEEVVSWVCICWYVVWSVFARRKH